MLGLRGLRALGKSVSAVLPRALQRSYRERHGDHTESISAVLPRAQGRSRYDRRDPIETFDTEHLTPGSRSYPFCPEGLARDCAPITK